MRLSILKAKTSQTNDLIKAESVWVVEQIELKKRDYREKNEPRWKLRIEGDIKKLRQDINLLARDLKGESGSKKKQKMKKLYQTYRVKRKGIKTVIEELKQRMLAKSAKVKRYLCDKKEIYAELNRDGIRSNAVPNVEKSTKFWGYIWGVTKVHNRGRMIERFEERDRERE